MARYRQRLHCQFHIQVLWSRKGGCIYIMYVHYIVQIFERDNGMYSENMILMIIESLREVYVPISMHCILMTQSNWLLIVGAVPVILIKLKKYWYKFSMIYLCLFWWEISSSRADIHARSKIVDADAVHRVIKGILSQLIILFCGRQLLRRGRACVLINNRWL